LGAILSAHFGQLMISTAATAAHADVSPANLGQDLLWKPPLVAEFIRDPHFYGPDWSAFQCAANFQHQLDLLYINTRNGLGHPVARRQRQNGGLYFCEMRIERSRVRSATLTLECKAAKLVHR
jgi:hypothetical protein